ncbi:TonB-dependent siderophore receptor [Rhodoferax koreense]|uniref:TonB-dependent siderophore receptor n=1 Tax=Rhodoferax koreensis TaxID=1842727 RepID=A0A1P8K4M0_9BURK|nr:TonB-dependent siderophore receptor [Rhodoferax koreense]
MCTALCVSQAASAQTLAVPATQAIKSLSVVTVNASADASAGGLSPAYVGGQVARGGRAGILGTQDNMDTPFSITSYTNELIQDRQARSVGDVLQTDPGVRVARGFGNFQEAYFIRGFILSSDAVAYNGLYSLLPRQYIATELFERVEVLRGASAFLIGANPGSGGIGGAINLLPKRAPDETLSRVTTGTGSGSQANLAVDVARRFGPDNSTGIRVNAAARDGGTAVDHEKAKLGLLAVGLDWHSRDVRLSADIGYQNNNLRETRPSVSLSGVTSVPDAPDASANFAQPWSYANERDTFSTLRGEFDINNMLTAWAAYGLRRSSEANSLANLSVTNSTTGAGTTYRFDNTRKDAVDTGEIGIRGKLRIGAIGHEWVASASSFELETKNAFTFDFGNQRATGLYNPVSYALPAFSVTAVTANAGGPALNTRTKLRSFALGDTLSFLDNTLLLTLGARHQTLETQSFAVNTGVPGTPYSQSRTSPAAGAVYKLNKQVSFYGNYIEGLSKGDTAPATANSAPVTNRGDMLAPYVSKQKEVGVKYDGGRLGGAASLFSTTKPRAYTNAAQVFSAAGEDEHRGLELTAYGEARRGLKVLGGITWLDAKQKSTGSAATDDKRVIGVPRLQANLGAEWAVPAVQGLALDARLVYTGTSYADAANALRVSGWTRLDLGARYLMELQGRVVTLRARVDNVANRDYWASAGGSSGSGYLVVGAPRSFVLSASVDF